MRKLVAAAVLAAFGWCGYLIGGAAAIDAGLEGWLKARRDAGWRAEAAVTTGGFPFGFRTRVERLELFDPRAGLSWSLPRLELSAAGHRPTRVSVDTGAAQVFATPIEVLTIRTDRSTGLLDLKPGPRLELREAAFDLGGVTVSSDRGWRAALSQAGFSTRAVGGDAHEVVFSGQGFVPPEALRQVIDPAGLLPEAFDSLDIAARLDFDAPWDRRAIEWRRPQFEAIDLTGIEARWGPMALRASGAVTVDGAGVPEGALDLQVRDWRRMLDLALAAGLLPPDTRGPLERTLGFLAGMSGEAETLDLPLSFRRGLMLVGPLPVGPAPRLVLR